MRAVVVDDEELVLSGTVAKLWRIKLCDEVIGFSSPSNALDYLQQNEADIAFFDVEMSEMNGMDLARLAREAQPDLYVVFLTGFTQYAERAFHVRANGYLTKPVPLAGLRDEIERASLKNKQRWQLAKYISEDRDRDEHKRIRIQTFGRFEVFVDDDILRVQRQKSKELLALLVVQRGAVVSTDYLAEVLSPRDEFVDADKNSMRIWLHDLTRSLQRVEAQDIICKEYRSLALNCKLVQCDYFDYLAGDPTARHSFKGRFMEQYSWAEEYLAGLTKE